MFPKTHQVWGISQKYRQLLLYSSPLNTPSSQMVHISTREQTPLLHEIDSNVSGILFRVLIAPGVCLWRFHSEWRWQVHPTPPLPWACLDLQVSARTRFSSHSHFLECVSCSLVCSAQHLLLWPTIQSRRPSSQILHPWLASLPPAQRLLTHRSALQYQSINRERWTDRFALQFQLIHRERLTDRFALH